MVYTFNVPANNLEQTVSGGTVSTAEHKDLLVEWVQAYERNQTPILDKVWSNEEVDSDPLQWGQSYRKALEATVVTPPTTTAGTTFTVEPGESKLFQKNMTFDMFAYKAGTNVPDPATLETMRVVSIDTSTDTITVLRADGTPAYGSHAAGAIVYFTGTTEPQNSEHAEAARVRGDRFFNYFQRFNAKMQADIRAQNMPTWEHPSNAFLTDFEGEVAYQKQLLERALFHGRRVAETASKGGKFGGLDNFIVTNKVNMAAAKLTVDAIDDVLADLYLRSSEVNMLSLVGSINTIRLLDKAVDPALKSTYTGGVYETPIRTIGLRTGTFAIEPTLNVPDGKLYLVDWGKVKLRPFKGANWHITERKGSEHAVDNDIKAISGDFSLQVNAEHTMAIMDNFDPIIANY